MARIAAARDASGVICMYDKPPRRQIRQDRIIRAKREIGEKNKLLSQVLVCRVIGLADGIRAFTKFAGREGRETRGLATVVCRGLHMYR